MATNFDLVVRGGTVVAHDQERLADIGVVDGVIVAVGPDLGSGRDEYDATGLHVLPGLLDVHVHMREPGWPEKGDFHEGTRAAAVGGVTVVVDMPNTEPPVIDVTSLTAKRNLLARRAHVDFGLYALFDVDNADAFAELAAAGCMGLKLYLARSVTDVALADDATIIAGLRAARAARLLVGVHAEDPGIIAVYTQRLQAAGRTDPAAHSEARPVESEAMAIERIGRLAQAAGVGLHIHHLSSAAGMGRVRELRARGLDVSVEAVVAHLVMTVEDYKRHGNLVTLNPPLRTGEDRSALWRAVAAAEINIIATDHAPHTPEEQDVADVWCAHGGFAGVETLLPVLLAQVAEGRLELTDIVRMCSFNPAQRWGIARKGQLVPGADADMVLVDLTRSFTIRAAALQSRHKVTPFDGLVSPGAVRATFLRGIMVAENGVAVGEPRGRFLQPSCPSQMTTTSSGRQL